MRTLSLAVATGASLVAPPAPAALRAQDGLTVELYAGSAYHVPTPLTIHQTGERDIELSARYATRPWADAPYYALRVGHWTNGRAWEIELIHDKLYLRNPPPEVQRFEVSHGWNLFTVNRAVARRGTVWRVGAGLVIAHPEATVRQRTLSGSRGLLGQGYYVSGAATQLAGARRLAVWRKLVLAVEAKVTAAYARIPIPDGHAQVPSIALHGLLGVVYTF